VPQHTVTFESFGQTGQKLIEVEVAFGPFKLSSSQKSFLGVLQHTVTFESFGQTGQELIEVEVAFGPFKLSSSQKSFRGVLQHVDHL